MLHEPDPLVKRSSDPTIRTKALEAFLVEKGLITTDAIDEIVRMYEQDIGPMNGARVVARAWTDPTYKQRLLENANAALGEMGFTERQDAEMVVVENSAEVHNVVVCTLCSCYPWSLLGLPPNWYKSFAYRSRVVREPPRCAGRVWPGTAGLGRDSGVGLYFRYAVYGAAGTARRDRRPRRG